MVSLLYLDPRKEQVDSIHVVVLCLPECQEFKIGVDIWLLQQFAKKLVHFDRTEHIECDGNHGQLRKKSALVFGK